MDKNGQIQDAELSRSSGMDLGLAWDLLTNCIDASRILNTDAAFRSQLEEVRSNLQPFRIGSKGQLLEWEKEFEEIDPKHRHVSHLFALHPGRQILPERDTELANACRRTLELRGDGGTGWAMAWKINFWARLHDGNNAEKRIEVCRRYPGEHQRRGHICQPVRRSPALPDRRQLRWNGRYHGNALTEPCRLYPSASRPARQLAGRQYPRHPCKRRFHNRHGMEERKNHPSVRHFTLRRHLPHTGRCFGKRKNNRDSKRKNLFNSIKKITDHEKAI